MAVSTSCPNCGRSYTLKERLKGCRVRCPHCFHKFVVPYTDGTGMDHRQITRHSQIKGVVLILIGLAILSGVITWILFVL